MNQYKDHFLFVLFFFTTLLFSFHLYGQPDPKKIDSFKQAIKISKTDTDKVKLMLALIEPINCNDTLSEISYAKEALALAQKIKWNKGISCAYVGLGTIYHKCMKNYPFAIEYYQHALSTAKNSDDKLNQVKTLKDIGDSYQCLSQYVKALDYYREVLKLMPDPDNKIVVLGNMGLIYFNLGDYPNSLAFYDSSLIALDEYIR